MKKIIASLLFMIVLAASVSSCMSSRGVWNDCPSHNKNYFKIKSR